MATLEIHEVGQRVRRVRIGRTHPVMFGTNSLCDVFLNDPSVRGFHGRIRWSKTNFKVEAVAEVPFVEVNGRKVKSKSLRQGDEVRVGHCRIFLLSIEDDGPDHGEKTVIQAPPTARDFAEVAGGDLDPTPPAERPRQLDYHQMEMAPPSLEFPEDDDESTAPPPARPDRAPRALPPRPARPTRSTAFDDLSDFDQDDDDQVVPGGSGMSSAVPGPPGTANSPTPSPTDPSWPRRITALIRGTDRPPGDERVFTSPVVIGLALTFVVLIGLSVGLYQIIVRTNASNRFAAATDSYDRGDFLHAIKAYDAYLTTLPNGKRANKARAYRALARVRQHTGASASWNNAFKEAGAMIDEVGDLPEYRDVSVNLAEEVRKVAEGMLDRARDLADPAWLKQAEAAVALHSRVAGSAADSLVARSKIPGKLVEAEKAIQKAADLKAAITAIDGAIGSNRPGIAYRARTTLIRHYPDLATSKDVTSRLGKINDLIRQGVRFDPSGRPGLTEPRNEPLGPPTSLVLRLDPTRGADRQGPTAFALADGWAWGFDGASGAPLWQVAVGLAAPFAPVLVPGGNPTVLMVDARSNELVCRDGRTGRLLWRQTLEGWASDPPLVLGARILQPTVDGRLLEIDLRTGDLRGTLRLGRRITRTPIINETAERAYLLGEEDCLFVLNLDPLGCEAIEFLGHEAGTVACSPTRASRLFVLPENQGLDSGRWRVFLMDLKGVSFRQVQEIPIGGWTWGSPVASGALLWSASDRGEVAAYTIGRLDAQEPLTLVARLAPSPDVQGPAFPRARSDRELTVASGLSARYDLDIDRSRLAPVWTQGAAGRALAPPQVVGPLTVLTQQAPTTPGVALWGIETRTGAVRWRTVVGTPWPAPWIEAASGEALTSLLADGRELTLSRDQLRAGGFIEQRLPQPGRADVVLPGATRLEVAGTTVLIPSLESTTLLVRNSASDFQPVALPTPLATRPLPVGRNLLIPGTGGRLYLIEPNTGLSVADPFVPPFDRSRPTIWRTPVAVDGEATVVVDSEGMLRRFAVETKPRPRLVVTAERKLDSPAISNPASTGPAFLVATADLKVRSFAARDLAPLGSWPIATAPTLGPVAVSGFGFVVDASGQILAFDLDGRRLWTANLREPRVVGGPLIRDDGVWFATRDGGGVEGFRLADGSSLGQTRLDVEPTAGLLGADDTLMVATGLSTWQTFTTLPEATQATGGTPR